MKRYIISLPKSVWLLGALAVAGGLKISLLLANMLPFNADQAVDALMARHILAGERPIFFYGQEYMGSLDSWLLAAAFRLLGESTWVITLVQGLLFAGTILTTARIGWLIFKDQRVGLIAAWLLAIPAVYVTLYTTINMGVYGEILLLGNLIVLIGLEIGRQISTAHSPDWYLWALLGFTSGLGFWALPLTLVYTIPVAVYLIVLMFRYQQLGGGSQPRWRSYVTGLAFVLGGAVVGASPWLYHVVQNGFGSLIAQFTNGGAGQPLIEQVIQHLLNFSLLGISVIFGLRPPWTLEWLGVPLIPFVVAFWIAVLVWLTKTVSVQDDRKPERLILLFIVITLIVAFVVTPFGRDPSGRYFLPLAITLALFAGDLIVALRVRLGRIAYGLVALILIHNLLGTYQGIISFPSGLTTRFDVVTSVNQKTIYDLVSFLEDHGETRGYTNYWVAYPLAFFSNEELIFIPHLPYHSDFSYTTHDDRYVPYDQAVAASPHVAYITTNFLDLDEYLRDKFATLGIEWDEEQIGDFHVFYNLSGLITADEIGLGSDKP